MFRHDIAAFAAALMLLTAFGMPARADLAQAQSLYERGRVAEALNEVKDVLARDPGDPEARFLQGIVFADLGRTEQAIEVFAGLTQDYPELPEPYNNLAVLFAEQGDFEKARDALMSAIQTHPSYSTAHENLGDLYARMAGIAYDRALEEDRLNNSARIKLSAVNGLFSVPRDYSDQPVATPPNATVQEIPASNPEPAPVVATPAPRPAVVEQPRAEPPVQEPVVVAAATPAPKPVRSDPPPRVDPVPTPAAPQGADPSNDIRQAVRNWASAWSAQNVDDYLGAYASQFRPANGAPRAAWAQYRRERITAPSSISVDVGTIDVEMVGGDTARASFVQGYSSESYQDRVMKTLTLRRENGAWRITSEVSEAI